MTVNSPSSSLLTGIISLSLYYFLFWKAEEMQLQTFFLLLLDEFEIYRSLACYSSILQCFILKMWKLSIKCKIIQVKRVRYCCEGLLYQECYEQFFVYCFRLALKKQLAPNFEYACWANTIICAWQTPGPVANWLRHGLYIS